MSLCFCALYLFCFSRRQKIRPFQFESHLGRRYARIDRTVVTGVVMHHRRVVVHARRTSLDVRIAGGVLENVQTADGRLPT